MLGWCRVDSSSFTLSLFNCEDGLRCWSDIENIVQSEFTVLSIANKSTNLIHIAFQTESVIENLPIIVVVLDSDLSKVLSTRFPEQKDGKKSIEGVKKVYLV